MNYPNAIRSQDLIPDSILRTLPHLYAQDGKGDEAIVYLKMFCGSFTWYVTELDPETGEAFGKVYSHICPDGELGYIYIPELQEIKVHGFVVVERDAHWTPKPLGECKNPCGG